MLIQPLSWASRPSPTSDQSAGPSDRQRRGYGTIAAALIAGSLVASLAGCQWAATGQNTAGTRLYEQGQYTAALQEFQKAVVSDPNNADGYYNLAATKHRLGKQRRDNVMLQEAEALYNQCLDHDGNHVECHRALAVLLKDTNRPDRAFSLLKNWAEREPRYAEPRIELARLYEEANEPATALKYLEDAVQQDANNGRAWLALARLRETSGDAMQALQNYQRAYALNNMQPQVAERIAALSRQINSSRDAALNSGQTQIARPLDYANQRY
ncbi:MAG: tetratricopeptide repeat protein [Planctomycetota bacterium]